MMKTLSPHMVSAMTIITLLNDGRVFSLCPETYVYREQDGQYTYEMPGIGKLMFHTIQELAMFVTFALSSYE